MKKIGLTLAIVLLSSSISIIANQFVNTSSTKIKIVENGNNQQNQQNKNVQFQNKYVDFTVAAEKTIHAVVNIRTEFQQKNVYYDDFFGFDNPFYNFFYGSPNYNQKKTLQGTGSGVIVSEDGFIVTNNHVVQDATTIEVTLNDKRLYNAKIIGTDPSTDLALIKIEEKSLPKIAYGNSDSVKVGEWVLAVGNPFNLTSTVTAGIVSAKGRNLNILEGKTKIESFIQTDAAVNPGNSGGALVNSEGKLIGINTAIASTTGAYSGYSFAIPVNMVKKIVEDFITYGEVKKAYLGVTISELDAKLAKEKNITINKGVLIESVFTVGSAADAGLLKGDVILKIDNVEINTVAALQEYIASKRPGDKINVNIVREGKNMNILATLKNNAGNTTLTTKISESMVQSIGAIVAPVEEDEMSRLGITNGLQIKKIESNKLVVAGIREGLIILAIDNNKILVPEDIDKVLKSKKGGVLIEGIYPNGMRVYYGFGL